MVGDTMQEATHPYRDARLGEVPAEDVGAVGGLEDRLGDVLADLAPVDVEGRHHLDVTGPVAADLPVHEANLNFDITCLSR
jgi:hypothetical protein